MGHASRSLASPADLRCRRLVRRDPRLRAEAARALGAIGPAAKQAVPALLAAYERGRLPFVDPEEVVAALRQLDAQAVAQHGIR